MGGCVSARYMGQSPHPATMLQEKNWKNNFLNFFLKFSLTVVYAADAAQTKAVEENFFVEKLGVRDTVLRQNDDCRLMKLLHICASYRVYRIIIS